MLSKEDKKRIEEIKDFAFEVGMFGITSNDVKFVESINFITNLIEKLEEDEKKNKLTLFMVVRNSKVLPVGKRLGKTDKEITSKTKETIEELYKAINYEKAEEFYNLDMEE